MKADQRDQDKRKIRDFLLHKGADKFWVNAALKHIMLNFASNAHWLTEIRSPKAIIGAHGMVDKFTIICTINTEAGKTKGRLTYTFGAGHKVRVAAVK